MKEIIKLNRRICAESKGRRKTDDGTFLTREDGPDQWRGYSLGLKADAQAVHAELNRLIPEDFSYIVYLGEREPSFHMEYEDGAQTGMFGA